MDKTLPVAPQLSDPTTWRNIYIRMPLGTPKLTAYDFVAQYAANTKYSGRILTAFEIAASSDGVNWYTIQDKHLSAIPENAESFSGATATQTSIAADKLAKCFPFDYSKVPAAAAAKTIAVSVAKDATLSLKGAYSINSVSLSDAGMGTIAGSGVSLAATGSFEVPPLAEGAMSKTYATSLKDLTDAANLSNWTATVGGRAIYDLTYDPTTGNVTVSRKPFSVLFK